MWKKYHKQCHALCHKLDQKLGWISPLLLRLVMGWIFLQAGWGKLHNLDHTTQFFVELGIPLAFIQAPFVACVEFFGGLMLILGLCSRWAAFPLSITMIVALLTAKRDALGSLTTLLETDDFLYFLILVAIMAIGSGRASLDYCWCRNLDSTCCDTHSKKKA